MLAMDERITEHDLSEPVVDDIDQAVDGGAFGDDPDAEIGVALAVERAVLSALLWAPAAVARAITAVLLPKHFVSHQHATIYAAIADVATRTAPMPALVNARLVEAGHYTTGVASLMVSVVSPAGPVPAVVEIPHLADKLLALWYRRGHQVLLARMAQHVRESPVEDLAGHWAQLTDYQHKAADDFYTRRNQLADLT
ncbi:DnaB-like helicase N terminal domain-containing protein [Williamsia sterculiae]|uniref:DnaB-like helicase N terminal domain-containing protein n=2 Tax=Williamsia sterculiae TaxID=1344003 RepID=A0A1N7HE48_9NOCA|nr:DnaB-like helicase N terminal domain-containing protein [Williamsia sterculiae]